MFLSKTSTRPISSLKYYFCLLWLSLLFSRAAAKQKHDETFAPDAILRVTAQEINIGGIQRLTTLVNDSIPGPELRIPEGEVTWIRVYNDMSDQNLTMVCMRRSSL